MSADRLVLQEDFAEGMADWWAEGGGRVWVEDGRLHVRADPPGGGAGEVATVWHRGVLPDDVAVELDAHVVSSSVQANNINLFLCYCDPGGTPLFETRHTRADAAYERYHDLTGYIVTFLHPPADAADRPPAEPRPARFRMRRCPGFALVAETYGYHCQAGRTYHLAVSKRGGRLTFAVDGRTALEWTDPAPLAGGLLGLRTYRTHLWWSHITARKPSSPAQP